MVTEEEKIEKLEISLEGIQNRFSQMEKLDPIN